MITVPSVPRGIRQEVQAQAEAPGEAYQLMAAATMHEQGRLVEPTGLYIDEDGYEKDTENDKMLEPYRPQIDEMADRLSDSQITKLNKWFRGGGRLSDQDKDEIKPILDEADTIVKSLPKEKREGNSINMYNWRSLFMDEVFKARKKKGPSV